MDISHLGVAAQIPMAVLHSFRDAEGIVRIPDPHETGMVANTGAPSSTGIYHSGMGDWTGYGKRGFDGHTKQLVTMSYKRPRTKRGRTAGPCSKELKWFETATAITPILSTGSIIPSLNLIPDGVEEKERVGRCIFIKKISWRYTLKIPRQDNVGNAKAGDVVRVILFLDKQSNGAAAGPTDILNAADWQSFNKLVNKDRFYTVYDKTHVLNYLSMARDSTAGEFHQAPFLLHDSMYKNVDSKIDFNDVDGTIDELCCNNYGILLITKGGLAEITGIVRIRFTDVS